MILFGAKYLLFFILGIAFGLFLRQPRVRQKEMVIAGALMSGVGFALSRIAGALYNDPRPFVTEHILPLIPHVADNGFPSDHALLGAVVAMIVFHFNRRLGVFLLILTLCVGVSRVLARVHHPIDIVGSFGIALLASGLVFHIIMPALRKRL